MPRALTFVGLPVFPHSERRCRWATTCRRRDGNRAVPCASDGRESLPKVWVCTSSTCRGNSLLSTMRAVVSDVEASIEPTGCLGECGNGPNVAVQACDSERVSIEKHIESLEQTVRLLKRLEFDVNDEMLRVAEEKEKGDMHILKGTVACAGEHYEKAIGLMALAESWLSGRTEQYRIAILCNWAQALVKCSDHERALSLVNEAIDVRGDCVGAWKWKAEAHEGIGEVDMAKKSWETWGELSGKKDEAAKRIGRITGWRGWFS